ncbi:MAG: ABC transporter permease subunit [Alphaproteobacteria bacterium]
MASYIARRLLSAIPTLFLIVALSFFMMRIAPGGPFDGERRLPPDIEMNMKRAYDLDKPIHVQFLKYLGGVVKGDFGPSFKNRDFTVSQLIAVGAPVSIRLGLGALLIATAIGLSIGIFAALHHNSPPDAIAMGAAMAGIAVPTFVVAPLLILLFAVTLHWLPAGDWGGGDWRHLILPVVTLALPQIAIIARLARASILEILRSISSARAAKGVSDFSVMTRHVLRVSLLPLVSYLGPAAAALDDWIPVVERIYGLPGIGRYFVDGAINRDYTVVMGVVILYAALVLALNPVADLRLCACSILV